MMNNMRGGGPHNQGNGGNWNQDRERSPIDEQRNYGGEPYESMNYGGSNRNPGPG